MLDGQTFSPQTPRDLRGKIVIAKGDPTGPLSPEMAVAKRRFPEMHVAACASHDAGAVELLEGRAAAMLVPVTYRGLDDLMDVFRFALWVEKRTDAIVYGQHGGPGAPIAIATAEARQGLLQRCPSSDTIMQVACEGDAARVARAQAAELGHPVGYICAEGLLDRDDRRTIVARIRCPEVLPYVLLVPRG